MALLPVDEARQRILQGVKRLPGERVRTCGDALGRVTAAPLVAKARPAAF